MTPPTGQDLCRSAQHFGKGFGTAKNVSVRLIATGNLPEMYKWLQILSNPSELRRHRGARGQILKCHIVKIT